ncbi:MAG: hypothetical protein V1796_08970, partial [Pseudomonadota bacterium]
RLDTDVLFIRVQSTIRADGPPSAQIRSLQLDISLYFDRYRRSGHCALARANRVFRADKKRIRTENAVLDKNNKGLALPLSNKRNSATTTGAILVAAHNQGARAISSAISIAAIRLPASALPVPANSSAVP